jgi:hypothetical protein
MDGGAALRVTPHRRLSASSSVRPSIRETKRLINLSYGDLVSAIFDYYLHLEWDLIIVGAKDPSSQSISSTQKSTDVPQVHSPRQKKSYLSDRTRSRQLSSPSSRLMRDQKIDSRILPGIRTCSKIKRHKRRTDDVTWSCPRSSLLRCPCQHTHAD